MRWNSTELDGWIIKSLFCCHFYRLSLFPKKRRVTFFLFFFSHSRFLCYFLLFFSHLFTFFSVAFPLSLSLSILPHLLPILSRSRLFIDLPQQIEASFIFHQRSSSSNTRSSRLSTNSVIFVPANNIHRSTFWLSINFLCFYLWSSLT